MKATPRGKRFFPCTSFSIHTVNLCIAHVRVALLVSLLLLPASLIAFEEAPDDGVILSTLRDGIAVELRTEHDQADLVIRSATGGEVDYQINRADYPHSLRVTIPQGSLPAGFRKTSIPMMTNLISNATLSSEGNAAQIVLTLNNNQAVSYEAEPIAGSLYVTVIPKQQESYHERRQAEFPVQPVSDTAYPSFVDQNAVIPQHVQNTMVADSMLDDSSNVRGYADQGLGYADQGLGGPEYLSLIHI